MNDPVKGQVYLLTPSSSSSLKAGPYEVIFAGVRPGDSHFVIRVKANRIGAEKTWSYWASEWAKLSPKLLEGVEGKSGKKANIRTNRKVAKEVGAIGMARRYYNSKTIVLEPCEVVSVADKQVVVEWMLDGKTSPIADLTEYDPNWIPNKLKEMDNEIARLQMTRSGLYATWYDLSPTKLERKIDEALRAEGIQCYSAD